MRKQNRRTSILLTFATMAVLLVVGCATNPAPPDTASESSDGRGDVLVIGRFQLIRNDMPVALGEGIFANRAILHVYDDSNTESINAPVGQDGAFQWRLQHGDYHIRDVEFMLHGERFSPSADLRFSVAGGSPAVYVGTITLRTEVESGYYGLDGSVKAFTVRNDCEIDCAVLIAMAGISDTQPLIALAHD